MTKIIPQGKYILVGEEKQTTKTAGGIILEGVSMGVTKIFSVVDVGSEVKNVTQGDRVVLKLNDALPIDLDGVQRLLAPAENVLAIIQ